ncbi:MAG TPA: hypothetical protein VNU70_11880 [Puia sp.]|jgi:microsomal dipeptidase-like Zn-dependent dipeptidase|nr:hypothetical protein [Puia sp.]
MNYFDFHTHVLLKQLFEDQPDIGLMVGQRDVKFIPKLCSDLPYIIESQIHQSQLLSLKSPVLVGAVLYGMESYLADVVDPLRSYLKDASQFKVSDTVLKAIGAPAFKTFTSFTLTNTMNRYLGAPDFFRVLNKANCKQPLNGEKVNIFFVVEGCHSLVDSKNRVDLNRSDGYDPKEILANLDVLLKKAPILSVNLTHLQQSNLCNHAFGMQIADPSDFYPTGNGLDNAGRTVVQGLFDRKVCVDVKHMSYFSRLQLRNEIDAGKYKNIQPLLCTHAGFTGTAFDDWPAFIRVKKPLNASVLYLEITKNIQSKYNPSRPGAAAFNLSTINLFDEEIVWIVRNGGMIGLSMDRRILGFVGQNDQRPTGLDPDCPFTVDKEYLSSAEWKGLEISDGQIGGAVHPDNCELLSEVVQSTNSDIPTRNTFFYAHVLLHIKHFLQVCIKAGIPLDTARKQLTIGSDFDGVINPFINFQTCLDMPGLKSYIHGNLHSFLKDLTDSAKWADQLDIDSFTEDLFFNNGYNFVTSFLAR